MGVVGLMGNQDRKQVVHQKAIEQMEIFRVPEPLN